jgi:hypothetical protein
MAYIAPSEGLAGGIAPLPPTATLSLAPFLSLLFQRRPTASDSIAPERISR